MKAKKIPYCSALIKFNFHFFFCCVLLLHHLPVRGQDQRKVDSLKQIVRNSDYDTAKIWALKDLAWQYYATDPATCRQYVRKLLSRANKIHYTYGIYKGYNIYAVLAFGHADYDSAEYWFKKALSLSDDKKFAKERIYSLTYLGNSYLNTARFEKCDSCFNNILAIANSTGNRIGMGLGHKNLGISAYTVGNYQIALNHYLKADSLLGEEASIDKGETLQNIGIVYNILENVPAQKFYYAEALKVYEEMDDEYGFYAIYSSLGTLENKEKNFIKAKNYFSEAVSYFSGINDPSMLGEAMSGLGDSYHYLNDYDSAIYYYKKSVDKLDSSEGNVELSESYLGLGQIYMKTGDRQNAAYYLDKAYEAAQKTSKVESSVDILEAQAEFYFQTGDYEKAYLTRKNLQMYADSMNVIRSSKVMHELDTKYQTEKKQHQIELLTAQNELAQQEKKDQLYLLIAALVLTLLLALFFYYLYHNRQKTNRKLLELDKMKSDFFANISHEFRTPLTLIKGPLSDQLANNTISEKEKKNLELMDMNADRLITLVDQLLDLSKIEAGGLHLHIQPGSANSFVRGVASSFLYTAGMRSQTLQIHVEEEKDASWFDQDVFQKVITNLLSNAIKYTPDYGKIDFYFVVNKNMAQIKVLNSGEGIAREEKDRIFTRFYQGNEMKEGVGIGLALVKELVTLHRGTIVLQSEQNRLTEFVVTLPVYKEAFEPAELIDNFQENEIQPILTHAHLEEASEAESQEENRPIMLVAEDHKDLRNMIREMFEPQFKVLEAEDGLQGVVFAIENVPDIIISDIMMPGKNGVDLCKQLKTDERTSHIPIILLTAKAGEENELLGLETGADEYMVKPFSKDILRVRVQKLIELRIQLRERYSQEVILRPKDIAICSADEKFLTRLQILMDEKLTDSEFSAETFSHEMGMSRMQLHRKLKALVGLTTSEFIKSQRLKMATFLLETAEINMSEVGYEVGFNDPSYFAKCFKETYGCTPKQYTTSRTLR